MSWNNIYISDKSGKRFFNTTASPCATISEITNLKNHIRLAKKYPQHYGFLDADTAEVFLNGEQYTGINISADDMYNLLISD